MDEELIDPERGSTSIRGAGSLRGLRREPVQIADLRDSLQPVTDIPRRDSGRGWCRCCVATHVGWFVVRRRASGAFLQPPST